MSRSAYPTAVPWRRHDLDPFWLRGQEAFDFAERSFPWFGWAFLPVADLPLFSQAAFHAPESVSAGDPPWQAFFLECCRDDPPSPFGSPLADHLFPFLFRGAGALHLNDLGQFLGGTVILCCVKWVLVSFVDGGSDPQSSLCESRTSYNSSILLSTWELPFAAPLFLPVLAAAYTACLVLPNVTCTHTLKLLCLCCQPFSEKLMVFLLLILPRPPGSASSPG